MANKNSDTNLCQEIEACRTLIKELEEEARKRSPFNEAFVDKEKLDKYIILLQQLQKLKEREQNHLKNLLGTQEQENVT